MDLGWAHRLKGPISEPTAQLAAGTIADFSEAVARFVRSLRMVLTHSERASRWWCSAQFAALELSDSHCKLARIGGMRVGVESLAVEAVALFKRRPRIQGAALKAERPPAALDFAQTPGSKKLAGAALHHWVETSGEARRGAIELDFGLLRVARAYALHPGIRGQGIRLAGRRGRDARPDAFA